MEQKQVLLIGFGSQEEMLRDRLSELDLEVRTYGPSCLSRTVGELCQMDQENLPEEGLQRGLVLFHRFTREDLDPVLKVLRQAGISRQPLKAMVTPTNWHWKVENLLEELGRGAGGYGRADQAEAAAGFHAYAGFYGSACHEGENDGRGAAFRR